MLDDERRENAPRNDPRELQAQRLLRSVRGRTVRLLTEEKASRRKLERQQAALERQRLAEQKREARFAEILARQEEMQRSREAAAKNRADQDMFVQRQRQAAKQEVIRKLRSVALSKLYDDNIEIIEASRDEFFAIGHAGSDNETLRKGYDAAKQLAREVVKEQLEIFHQEVARSKRRRWWRFW